jgi:hypothetical protein
LYACWEGRREAQFYYLLWCPELNEKKNGVEWLKRKNLHPFFTVQRSFVYLLVVAITDKIVVESGTKYITSLSGQKGMEDLVGDADKSTTLTGQKYISDLAGNTGVTLYGNTIIISLSGNTIGDILNGATDKIASLLGGACDARFHVTVDDLVIY